MFPLVHFPKKLSLRINEPCGRLFCDRKWERTRENSLNLRDWELWLVWRGRGWMRTVHGRHPLFAGFCVLMRPGGIYDAGHDEDDPLGITYIHFDVLRAAEPPLPSQPQFIHLPPEQWPEFFILGDIEYSELLTRRIIELLADNPAAATALLYAFLADLLEREPLAEQAWDTADRAQDERASGNGVRAVVNPVPPPRSKGCIQDRSKDSAGGSSNAGIEGRSRGSIEDRTAATGSEHPQQTGRAGSVRLVPHYRELQQLIAKVRTTSPEALPTVGEMAASLGMSQEHFSRLFRRVSGRSPMQFIVGQRTGHARHLLRESSLSVSEIAERLGYGDVYFFSRQFKEQTGLSPLAYRRHG